MLFIAVPAPKSTVRVLTTLSFAINPLIKAVHILKSPSPSGLNKGANYRGLNKENFEKQGNGFYKDYRTSAAFIINIVFIAILGVIYVILGFVILAVAIIGKLIFVGLKNIKVDDFHKSAIIFVVDSLHSFIF